MGYPKPQVTAASGAITVAGQVGAAFNAVTLESTQSISGTALIIARTAPSGLGEIDRVAYPAGTSQQLYKSTDYIFSPAISPDDVVAFCDLQVATNSHALRTIKSDGTGLGTISFTGISYGPESPSYATDGTDRIAQ